MTIAIQRSEHGNDTIYFDAVISTTSSYTSKVSSHPVDGGPSVDDHVVTENPVFTVKGVISSADFGSGRPIDRQFINQTSLTALATVKSSADSILEKLSGIPLPFGMPAEPVIEVGTLTTQSLNIVRDTLIDMRDKKESVSLIYFTNGQPTSTEPNLVITSLQFSEDADTGDSLSVELTLQRVKFVPLIWTEIATRPKKVSAKVKDAASAVANKGFQAGKQVSKEEQTKLQESLSAARAFVDKYIGVGKK